MLHDSTCQDLSFSNILGEDICSENLVAVWILYYTSGAAWPTGTPRDFPVGHQKFVACGPPRQAIFSPISLVKINKLFVISAPASLILIFTYGAIKAKILYKTRFSDIMILTTCSLNK